MLDTLILVRKNEKFEEYVIFLNENLEIEQNILYDSFEDSIRALEGLLSAHTLSKDLDLIPAHRKGLLDLCKRLADSLIQAIFDPPVDTIKTLTSAEVGGLSLSFLWMT